MKIPDWIKFSRWEGTNEAAGPVRRFHGFGSLKAQYVSASVHYVEGQDSVTMDGKFIPSELREVADMIESGAE